MLSSCDTTFANNKNIAKIYDTYCKKVVQTT